VREGAGEFGHRHRADVPTVRTAARKSLALQVLRCKAALQGKV